MLERPLGDTSPLMMSGKTYFEYENPLRSTRLIEVLNSIYEELENNQNIVDGIGNTSIFSIFVME